MSLNKNKQCTLVVPNGPYTGHKGAGKGQNRPGIAQTQPEITPFSPKRREDAVDTANIGVSKIGSHFSCFFARNRPENSGVQQCPK